MPDLNAASSSPWPALSPLDARVLRAVDPWYVLTAARRSDGGEPRVRQALFPARKTVEEFDFTFQRSVKKQVIEHLGQLDCLHERSNILALGPPDHLSHCPPRCRYWSNSPVAAPA